ncbi:unnamed protein product [Rotaria sp. Silwood2]|nr:unnamed protein product [Rotaria sp. Silwood2]CAF3342975.1 unnamed protein product [Rotaria sp. Silwood2]CAF4160227.1 unnamed protein product [Rotaria sp. Silwood2]CAF4167994.1 unnamed protein product [Rotaria sp. Silwood2]
MRTKSPINQQKNLQLESLYLREAYTRIQAWKQYQDKISEERCNWPPPINGKTYNKYEEIIYSVNTNNSNYDSWFHRNIYKNFLMKTSQTQYMIYDLNKSISHKETKLEQEVRQLREKLKNFQLYKLNDIYLKPMYPVLPSIHYYLYNGISKELEGRLNYLNKRKIYAPNEKYYEPLCSSWDITWNIKNFD